MDISRGYLAKLIGKVSESLAKAYAELFERLPGEAVLNIDETGHKENREKFWTWCFRAQLYTLFRIDKSRGSKVLVEVLGEEFNGVLGCDYFSAYRKYMREFDVLVQFCMAHLIRDVKFLLTLPGRDDQAYGQRLRDALRDLFAVIHRREKMTAAGFQKALEAAREQVMKAATTRVPDTKHARNLAKRFRENGEAYFRFITTPGIDPTNNLAEQAIRFVVIDRRHHPGDAERKRPPLVRADLDGDRHLRPAGSCGLSVPVGLGPSLSLRHFAALAPAVRPLTAFSRPLFLHSSSAALSLPTPPRERSQGKEYTARGIDGDTVSMNRRLLPHHRHHHGAAPRTDVAFQVNELLPGAQHGLAVGHRRREGRPQERGLQMRMAVAVVPGLLVAVVAARRDQPVEHFGQVALEARLELDRADRRRAAHAEHLHDARLDARAPDDGGNLVGDLGHVPVACRLEGELFLAVMAGVLFFPFELLAFRLIFQWSTASNEAASREGRRSASRRPVPRGRPRP